MPNLNRILGNFDGNFIIDHLVFKWNLGLYLIENKSLSLLSF